MVFIILISCLIIGLYVYMYRKADDETKKRFLKILNLTNVPKEKRTRFRQLRKLAYAKREMRKEMPVLIAIVVISLILLVMLGDVTINLN